MAEKVRAIRISGPGAFEFLEVEPPSPGPEEVLVRPLHLAICGSDIFKLHYEPVDSYPRMIGTTGHEMVGVVEQVGDRVKGIEKGTTALVLAPDHNAMIEQFIAQPEWVLALPGDRSVLEYLMGQQLGTVVYTCKRLPSVIGMTAAIIGQGSVGLFFSALLRRLGVQRVITFDTVPERVAFSREYGADEAIDSSRSDPEQAVADFTRGTMADIVIEAAGEVDSINLAPKLVREKGHLVFFGIPHKQVFEFDYWTFFRRYANTITSSGAMLEPGQGSFRIALDLIQSGAIDMSRIVTHHIPFDRVGDAYELARTKADGAIKVVVDMPGSDRRR